MVGFESGQSFLHMFFTKNIRDDFHISTFAVELGRGFMKTLMIEWMGRALNSLVQ